jgi:hypothetical protein
VSVPSVGEPITVVVTSFEVGTNFQFGWAVDGFDADEELGEPGFMWRNTNYGRLQTMFYWARGLTPVVRTEGVRWIRGHHDENSSEGRALLATYLLVSR